MKLVIFSIITIIFIAITLMYKSYPVTIDNIGIVGLTGSVKVSGELEPDFTQDKEAGESAKLR